MITVKLSQPDRVVKSGSYTAVIIPAKLSRLTVVAGRAPSMVMLENGVVQLLDSNYKAVAKYFIKGGYADIANDVCRVSSEVIVERGQISIAEAEAKLESSPEFYEMIINELKAF